MKTWIAAALLALGQASAAKPAASAATPLAVETFDAAWSIINTTYYDPTFRGVDWNAVRAELRPEAERARTPSELRAVIAKMIARLGESHFAVLPQYADPAPSGASAEDAENASLDRSGSPGFDVRPIGGELLITRVNEGSPAYESRVRPGDRLTTIGAVAVSSLGARLPSTLEPRIRNLEIWRAAMMRLRGPVGSRFIATITPAAGGVRTTTIERIEEPGQTVLLGNLPPMKLDVESRAVETPSGAAAGFIRFNVWMAGADAPFAAAVDRFRGSRGIIIDLRGNPGGLAGMIMGISGHFFSDRVALGTMTTRSNPPLTFYANPRRSTAAGGAVEPYAGRVAILIDGLTGSASECFAGGMQSVGRARIFGETSMGQALPASFTKLPNGDTLLHAIADFVTAKGTRLEGRGVIPDEPVRVDAAALASGRDPVLAAALKWLDAQ